MKKALITLCLAAVLLAGCSVSPQATPTASPEPEKTPTPEPTLAMADPVEVPEGGFTFRPPIGYQVDIHGAQIGIFDSSRSVVISLMGAVSATQNPDAGETIDQFVGAVFKKTNGTFETQNMQVITVDGKEGVICDLYGKLNGSSVEGQAAFVLIDDYHFLIGMGIAFVTGNADLWQNTGRRVFGSVLSSITFTEIVDTQSPNACVVSTDSTYGYTKDNPIRVGGDAFEGPARERAFFDNLASPNGEPVTYERLGSLDYGNTILDTYAVTTSGNTVTLYVDEYSFSEPQAPVGFTCLGAFAISDL
jgi:hypothetical protein